MASNLLVLGFACFFGRICFSASINLVLQATPSTIHPLLTRSLSLRCSLHHQRPVKDNTTNSNLTDFLQADGNTSQANLTHVMSIVITKENGSLGRTEEVASVSTYDGPIAEPPYSGSVHVEGNTDNALVSGEQGYLEVTWTSPNDTVSGLYSCQVFGLNAHNLLVSFKTFATIATELSILDLAGFISTNFKLVSDLQTIVGSLNSTRDQRVLQLEQQYEHLSFVYNQRFNELEAANAELTRQIEKLNSTCCSANQTGNKIENIQTGRLNCTSATNNVTYSRPFSEKPKVFTSVSHFNLISASATYQVQVVDEDKTGCTIICNTINIALEVHWMAIK